MVFRAVMIVLVCAVVSTAFMTIRLSQMASSAEGVQTELRDSLRVLQQDVDSLKGQVPGLGEYMTTNQLHIAKLWFAVGASNWQLATYELDEMQETMEAAEGLHAVKNGVNISPVLQSTRQTQLLLLEKAIAVRDRKAFHSAYSQTMAACNSCHKAAGYGFIHIVTPNHEPVANQQWNAPPDPGTK